MVPEPAGGFRACRSFGRSSAYLTVKRILPLILVAAPLMPAAAAPAPGTRLLKAEIRAFGKADRDDDDSLSQAEFLALCKPLPAARKRFTKTGDGYDPVELEAFALAFFGWFDFDESGTVEFDEWFEARTRAEYGFSGPPLDPEVLDRNRDGWVKAGEFLPLVNCFFPARKTSAMYRAIVAAFREDTGWQGSSNFNLSSSLELVVVGPEGFAGSIDTGVAGSLSSTDPAAAAGWLNSLPGRPESDAILADWTISDAEPLSDGEREGRPRPEGSGGRQP